MKYKLSIAWMLVAGCVGASVDESEQIVDATDRLGAGGQSTWLCAQTYEISGDEPATLGVSYEAIVGGPEQCERYCTHAGATTGTRRGRAWAENGSWPDYYRNAGRSGRNGCAAILRGQTILSPSTAENAAQVVRLRWPIVNGISTATISGVVVDERGVIIVDATVVAETPGGTRYGTRTNAAGEYRLPQVTANAVGSQAAYIITVEHDRYTAQERGNIFVGLQENALIDFSLTR